MLKKTDKTFDFFGRAIKKCLQFAVFPCLMNDLTGFMTASALITIPLGLTVAFIVFVLGVICCFAAAGVDCLVAIFCSNAQCCNDEPQPDIERPANQFSSQARLANAFKARGKKTIDVRDTFLSTTQEYINSFNGKIPHSANIAAMRLNEQEYLLLERYLDPTTHTIMDIPVLLDGVAHNLTSLQMILSGDRIEFCLNDIQPAQEVEAGINSVLAKIENNRKNGIRFESDKVDGNSARIVPAM